ncbi:MAG: thiol peroxidase [Clostridiales Family XIII bacterium]|nr:thiol peroxidase [Clostridiales Family XIII bacterium]
MSVLNITMGGNPITLPFAPLAVGGKLPDFTLTANDLSPVASSGLTGLRVFLAVPSLDTPVCDLEVRTFNAKAAELPGVSIYAVSMDLPFAQARWCGAAGVEAVKTLSDYRDRSFGKATGTLIDGLLLLTRAVFIVDAGGTVAYAQYVPEVRTAPDYDAAYAKLAALA